MAHLEHNIKTCTRMTETIKVPELKTLDRQEQGEERINVRNIVDALHLEFWQPRLTSQGGGFYTKTYKVVDIVTKSVKTFFKL